MASTFLTLPNDILLKVLNPWSRKNLLNVALVSSRLAGPAHRLLYRSIDLEPGFATRAENAIRDNHTHKRLRLVNTLKANSHLHSYASQLSIKVWMHTSQPRFGDHANLLHFLPNFQKLSLQPLPYEFLSMLVSPVRKRFIWIFPMAKTDHNGEKSQDPLESLTEWYGRLLCSGFA